MVQSEPSTIGSICASKASLRESEKEDPLLSPIVTEEQKEEIQNKYGSVTETTEEPEIVELLQKLWEFFEKHQEKEVKLIDRVKDQKEQISTQNVLLEEETNKVTECEQIIQQKEQEVIDIKKLVDASHLREQDSQEDIEFLRSQVVKLETEIQLKEQMQAELDAEMGISGKTREGFTKDKERMTAEIQSLRSNLKMTNELLSETQIRCDKGNAKIIELQAELSSKRDDLSRMTKMKTVAEKDTQDVKATVEQRNKEITNLKYIMQEKDEKFEKQETTINNLRMHIQRVEFENEELCKALSREQEEVYLLNCKAMEILESNEEFSKQYKLQETELVRLRKDAAKSQSNQDANTKRVSSIQKAKGQVEKELERVRYEDSLKAKEIDNKELEAKKNKRITDSVLREKEILKKNILKVGELARENQRKYELEAKLKEGIEAEKEALKKEMGLLRLKIVTLEKEKERFMADIALLTAKFAQSDYENKEKQTQIYNCKKEILEAETKLKLATNMFEAVRAERNNISHSLNETKDTLSTLRTNVKLINHEIEQLKEDIATKEQKLMQTEVAMRKKESDYEVLNAELAKCKEALRSSERTMNTMIERQGKLELQIEKEKKAAVTLNAQLIKAGNETSVVGTQLDRRSTELTLMHEKLKLVMIIMTRGEEQYNQRLDDIKLLRLEVKKLRHEKDMLKKSFENMADLRKEIFHLNRDLTNERQKREALEEEMENPINIHRWRILEAVDPDKKELMDKVQTLQKHVSKLSDENGASKMRIEELTELYEGAIKGLKRLPGLEASAELNKAKNIIRDKDAQLKVFVSEIKVCEEQLEQYKIEVKTLKKDLNEIKKKYYALKLKDDKRKQKEDEERNKMAEAEEEGRIQKVQLGGGFSLLQSEGTSDTSGQQPRPLSR